MYQSQVIITGKTSIGAAWWQLIITASEIAPKLVPGQFLLLRCDNACYLRRPIFPYRLDEQRLAILLRPTTDSGYAWLLGRHVGDTLDVIGPLGTGFSPPTKTENLLLVSDTQTIAPLLGQTELAVSTGAPVTLALGGSRVENIYPVSALPAAVEFYAATLDGSLGHKGLVSDLIPDLLPWADQVCAMGSAELYRSLKNLAHALRIERPGFLHGLYMQPLMACGVGACFGCAITTRTGIKLTCADGPVFDLTNLGDEP